MMDCIFALDFFCLLILFISVIRALNGSAQRTCSVTGIIAFKKEDTCILFAPLSPGNITRNHSCGY